MFQKVLIGFVRSCWLGVLIRGLQNLEAPFWKVLILFVRSRSCGELIRGSQNLELPARKRFYSFRLYEKNGEYPRGLRTSGLRGRFKALSKKISAKFSNGTCRNRFFAQNGSEKALNRCDAPVLQRKDLERRLKEQPYSLQTVGYGWVRMGDGGRKRVAWDGSKESFGQRKNFLFMEKVIFENSKERFVQKKSFWFAEKTDFSAHARPLGEEKLFFSTAKLQLPTAGKTNVQLQISSTKTYCELAVQHPFFETSQSCVSTAASLSHRFKSSPAIPGKLAIPGTAGYMMNAGHFRENYVSSGDLNRPRSPEVRKPLGYSPFFSYKRKE